VSPQEKETERIYLPSSAACGRLDWFFQRKTKETISPEPARILCEHCWFRFSLFGKNHELQLKLKGRHLDEKHHN
jgi:hypothetical protein